MHSNDYFPNMLSIDSGTMKVLGEIFQERKRQNKKWGQQDHPDLVGPSRDYLTVTDQLHRTTLLSAYARLRGLMSAETAKLECDRAMKEKRLDWFHISIEEHCEALEAALLNPESLRAELVQCAAVFAGWIEAIDRRTQKRESRVFPDVPAPDAYKF